MEAQGEENDYLQSSGMVNKVETLKSLITDILFSNTAYDCMPANSLICSIDKSASLYHAINILISQDLEELLVWDETENKWVGMLTIVDAIRLIMHALRTYTLNRVITFEGFQMNGSLNVELLPLDRQQVDLMIRELQGKRLAEVIGQIHLDIGRPYLRLKSAAKQSKLSFIILTMILQKIHRILIEDVDSKMFVSIINFKDVLLYLLRIANQSPQSLYSRVPITDLIDPGKLPPLQVASNQSLSYAFRLLTDQHRSLWINVVDANTRKFRGMLFREDFRDIFKGWYLNYLWMTVGEFIELKTEHSTARIPEFRYFGLEQTTKDIIWKIVMSRRNAIVCLDKNSGQVILTIGLMELFSLYVQ